MSQPPNNLVAANHRVLEDLQLGFGEDKDISINSAKTFDENIFDVLKVLPEDIANQLTLIDFALFKQIPPEELTCCAWASKKKYAQCPHVVEFIKRFNHVSFWVTREILSSNTAKARAERVSYFIKVAKKCLDISNLNCLKALVSSLQSAPIHRLTQTWNFVPKRDKEKLDRLSDLVSEEDNRQSMRDFLKNAKLPCIPYLGMYLTDLTYINTIHPATGGLDTVRNNKMNEILRIISDFQFSEYEVRELGHIKTYLLSVKYIDELQHFMEDENYKLSLQIEPSLSMRKKENREKESNPEKETKRLLSEPDDSSHSKKAHPRSANLAPKASSLNLPGSPYRPDSPDTNNGQGGKFTPGHRKARSLGNNSAFQTVLAQHSSCGSSLSSTSTGSQSLLDYSVAEETTECPDRVSTSSGASTVDCDCPTNQQTDRHTHPAQPPAVFSHNPSLNPTITLASTSYDSGLDHDEPEAHPIIISQGGTDQPGSGDSSPHLPNAYFKLQGFLKRKTHLKGASRPKVANWQRYWLGIMGSKLFYYLPKYRGFGGHEKTNFRSDPHKVYSLPGCTCFLVGPSPNSDVFQLSDEKGENVWRFRAGSKHNANLWVKHIREAADGPTRTQPLNLITFDDSADANESTQTITPQTFPPQPLPPPQSQQQQPHRQQQQQYQHQQQHQQNQNHRLPGRGDAVL